MPDIATPLDERPQPDDAAFDVEQLDSLVPAPRPTWQRMLIAVVLLVTLGVVAYAWQTGAFVPKPDCCGSGNGDVLMTEGPDVGSVTATVLMFNSSPRDIDVVKIDAQIEGATVTRVGVVPESGQALPVPAVAGLPGRLPAHAMIRLAVTFVPDDCSATRAHDWSITAELATTGRWPGIHRRFAVDPNAGGAVIRGITLPDSDADGLGSDPVRAACAVLDATG